MENKYKYSLDTSSNKYNCPECEKKRFVRYIDTETKEYLPSQYGRCDRENNCAYHLNPYLDGYLMENERSEKKEVKKRITKPKEIRVFFDFDTFKITLEPKRYKLNTFIQNLFKTVKFPFEVERVTKAIQLYRLGTIANGYRMGAITFPFIDIEDRIRAVQVKQFDENNNTTGTDFLHSIIAKQYNRNKKPLPSWLQLYANQNIKVSCLFGEHLLDRYPSNPIALVEAPKTAIYGTLYFGFPETPNDLIWLAVYNKSSFSFDKLKVLQGRFIYVFPDLSKDGSTFGEWETKAKEYESKLSGTKFIFSNLLEQLAPKKDKIDGSDLADYLIQQDWRKFKNEIKKPDPLKADEPKNKVVSNATLSTLSTFTQTESFKYEPKEKPLYWSDEVKELESFFSEIELPQTIRLDHCTNITDTRKFVDSHLHFIKSNSNRQVFEPYFNRLNNLKRIINCQ